MYIYRETYILEPDVDAICVHVKVEAKDCPKVRFLQIVAWSACRP